ncbi:MAG: alpha/beta hydrolase [Hyphobacterium sp.]|nr:MAG: alpha/beta hydrolase [Hyphobacterium sp.]
MNRTFSVIAALVALLALIIGVFWFQNMRPLTPSETVDMGTTPEIPDSPYWTDEDRWVEVGGLQVRVRMSGREGAPALILVHGFSVSLESWDAWADDLSADYRVIRMDLPGHGLTGPDPEQRYTVPQTAEFIGNVMDSLGIDRATIGANSLGGLAAWRFAANNPHRVSSLILVSPGGYSINGVTQEPVAVPAAVEAYLRSAPPAFVSAATATLYGDPSRLDPSVPERISALMRHGENGAAMVARLEVFTLPDPEADLARVLAPTLILHGERDVMIPVDHSRAMAAVMPDARLVTFENLGHVAHQEDPAGTLIEVRAFLNDGEFE